MPTTRPRYQVTETDELAHALVVAAREWPHAPRSQLIEKLAARGAQSLEEQGAGRRRKQAEALDALRDEFSGTIPANYLTELREGWPD